MGGYWVLIRVRTYAAQVFPSLRPTLSPLVLNLALYASCRLLDPILLEKDPGAAPIHTGDTEPLRAGPQATQFPWYFGLTYVAVGQWSVTYMLNKC